MTGIVATFDRITLVGGGTIGPQDINTALSRAPNVVAADGGADVCLAAGLCPVAVIGDLDSIGEAARTAYARVLHHIPEQDTTDFEKCLQRIRADLILCVGFGGGRVDHFLATLGALARYPDRRIVLLAEQDVICLIPAEGLRVATAPGMRVSVLPLAPARVASQGLRWETGGLDLDPVGLVSASNEAVGGWVSLVPDGPVVLVMPRAGLDAVLRAVVPPATIAVPAR